MSSENVTKNEAEQLQDEESQQSQVEELSSELEDSQLEDVAGGVATNNVTDDPRGDRGRGLGQNV